MSKLVLDGIDLAKLKEITRESDGLAKTITSLVRDIVNPATEELDIIMHEIYVRMTEGRQEVTLPEVEDYLMRLSAVMYRAEMQKEQIGILADTSKTIYEEVYSNAVRNSGGSAKDKREADGRIKAQYEFLCAEVRRRAYNIVKLKMEGAERQNKTLSRIITSRRIEFDRTLSDGTDN